MVSTTGYQTSFVNVLSTFTYNNKDYIACGDGETDDSTAINAALSLASQYGGVVYLPPVVGGYMCSGASITIPYNTTLLGSSTATSGMYYSSKDYTERKGSILLCSSDLADEDQFINMKHGSIINGVEVFYPSQVNNSSSPHTYGPTINVNSNQHGVTIRDVVCRNPYQFLTMNADGILIDGIAGYPLKNGFAFSRIADVPRVLRVTFSPDCLDYGSKLTEHVMKNGTAFTFVWAEEFMIDQIYIERVSLPFEFNTNDLQGGSYNGEASYGSLSNAYMTGGQRGVQANYVSIGARQGMTMSNVVKTDPTGNGTQKAVSLYGSTSKTAYKTSMFLNNVNVGTGNGLQAFVHGMWLNDDPSMCYSLINAQCARSSGEGNSYIGGNVKSKDLDNDLLIINAIYSKHMTNSNVSSKSSVQRTNDFEY